MSGLITRPQWGASRPTKAIASLNPARVESMTVHWPGTPGAREPGSLSDELAMMRGFQAFHQGTRGWADVGYNLGAGVISGRVVEARGLHLVGAHAGAYNSRSVGVVLIGHVLTPAARKALLEAWSIVRARYPAARMRVPHRDAPGAVTACPGDTAAAWVRAGMPGSQLPGAAPGAGKEFGVSREVVKQGVTDWVNGAASRGVGRGQVNMPDTIARTHDRVMDLDTRITELERVILAERGAKIVLTPEQFEVLSTQLAEATHDGRFTPAAVADELARRLGQ
jgi:hypothetical protein